MSEEMHLPGTFAEHKASECPGPPVCPPPNTFMARAQPEIHRIHTLACVEPGAVIGQGVAIWRWTLVRGRARIGDRVSLGSHCVIGDDVVIGNGCRIQDGAKVYGPAVLGENVFVGPGVVVTNDRHPRVHPSGTWKPHDGTTEIGDGASLGANVVLLAGVRIGKNAFVGAGSVVTRDVVAESRVFGVPAQTLPELQR